VDRTERFYRIDRSRSRATGGTGLGLAIVNQVVTLAGGFIQVDSSPGEGTRVRLYLPRIAADEFAAT